MEIRKILFNYIAPISLGFSFGFTLFIIFSELSIWKTIIWFILAVLGISLYITKSLNQIITRIKMKNKTFYKEIKGVIDKDPEIIGYIMEKDFLVITNPCRIPLELLEKQIKENKKNPPKENETKFIGTIMLKLPFKRRKMKNGS